MLNLMIIYMVTGAFVALLVLLKSGTKLGEGTYLATALIMFAWPVSVLHMIHVFFTAITSKGDKHVVTQHSDHSDSNRRTSADVDHVELPLEDDKKTPD